MLQIRFCTHNFFCLFLFCYVLIRIYVNFFCCCRACNCRCKARVSIVVCQSANSLTHVLSLTGHNSWQARGRPCARPVVTEILFNTSSKRMYIFFVLVKFLLSLLRLSIFNAFSIAVVLLQNFLLPLAVAIAVAVCFMLLLLHCGVLLYCALTYYVVMLCCVVFYVLYLW